MKFWNEEFLIGIPKMVEGASEDEAKALVGSLKKAQENIPGLKVEDYVQTLENHILYTVKKLKMIEDTRFWNIIHGDIHYYKEKQKLQSLREKNAASQ